MAVRMPPSMVLTQTVAPGLLVAMPQLRDAHFHRAVVLMLEHGPEGSMGLVVNKASPITLSDVAEGQSLELPTGREEQQVFAGGPVEGHRGFVLHDASWPAEKTEIVPGLYLSVTLDSLRPLLKDDSARLRFCLGYAGWGAGQLERELADGSWLYAEANGPQLLSEEPGQLWERTVRSMGLEPSLLMSGGGFN